MPRIWADWVALIWGVVFISGLVAVVWASLRYEDKRQQRLRDELKREANRHEHD